MAYEMQQQRARVTHAPAEGLRGTQGAPKETVRIHDHWFEMGRGGEGGWQPQSGVGRYTGHEDQVMGPRIGEKTLGLLQRLFWAPASHISALLKGGKHMSLSTVFVARGPRIKSLGRVDAGSDTG